MPCVIPKTVMEKYVNTTTTYKQIHQGNKNAIPILNVIIQCNKTVVVC